jgi:hypothetical protein
MRCVSAGWIVVSSVLAAVACGSSDSDHPGGEGGEGGLAGEAGSSAGNGARGGTRSAGGSSNTGGDPSNGAGGEGAVGGEGATGNGGDSGKGGSGSSANGGSGANAGGEAGTGDSVGGEGGADGGSGGSGDGSCTPECSRGLACGAGSLADTCGITAVPRPGQVCSVDGWCVLNPLPQGNPLNDVHARSPSDVWAVGDAGTVLHYDGEEWTGTTGLMEVAGTDVSFAGDNIVRFKAVWSSSETDVWIAGSHGLLRGDGVHWNEVTPTGAPGNAAYSSVWGTAADDVWVAAGSAGAFHFDGSAWSVHPFGTSEVRAIFGLGKNDVYFAVADGLYRYDGLNFTLERAGAVSGVWGSAASGLWAWSDASEFYQRIGTDWVTHDTEWPVTGLWADSASSVWITSSAAVRLAHFDGAWTEYSAGWPLQALESLDSETLLAVGARGYTIFADHSGAITEAGAPSIRGTLLFALAGTASDDVWFAGYDPVSPETKYAAHWDGLGFEEYRTEPKGGFRAITTVGSDEVWAVADTDVNVPGSIFSFDGSNFVQHASAVDTSYQHVWGADPTHVWALPTASATFYEWTGTLWQAASHPLTSSSVEFRRLWGRSGNNAWVVGTEGTTMHWNGASWTPRLTGTTDTLTSVWGPDDTSVWVTSREGRLHAWNGAEWSVPYSNLGELRTLCGFSSNSIWATREDWVNYQHFDGESWTPSRTGAQRAIDIRELACIDDELWATGFNSIVLRRSAD